MSYLPISPHKVFEGIKKIDADRDEYWEGRELMPLLGYTKWQNFELVINKAKIACSKSGQKIKHHFTDISKMVKLGSGSERPVKDCQLSRYACYIIAQNGDPSKQQIANAQTYFAVQTRKQEVMQQLSEEERRLIRRGESTIHNKELFKTAKKAGVTNFGDFNDMGYLGLYGMRTKAIKKKKRIGKDDILDRSGSAALAANLFRISQTEEKIKKENIKGQGRAALTNL